MSGGEISSNTATNYGGGVLVDMSDSFTVSGSAFVSGNARPDGSANNVYVYWTTITASNLTADASIGVTTGSGRVRNAGTGVPPVAGAAALVAAVRKSPLLGKIPIRGDFSIDRTALNLLSFQRREER